MCNDEQENIKLKKTKQTINIKMKMIKIYKYKLCKNKTWAQIHKSKWTKSIQYNDIKFTNTNKVLNERNFKTTWFIK